MAAAHNAVLAELFLSFVPRIRRAMVDMLRIETDVRGRDGDHEAHAGIVAAIRDRRPEDAATASRAHLTALRHRA